MLVNPHIHAFTNTQTKNIPIVINTLFILRTYLCFLLLTHIYILKASTDKHFFLFHIFSNALFSVCVLRQIIPLRSRDDHPLRVDPLVQWGVELSSMRRY